MLVERPERYTRRGIFVNGEGGGGEAPPPPFKAAGHVWTTRPAGRYRFDLQPGWSQVQTEVGSESLASSQ